MTLILRRMRPGEEGRLYEVLRAAVLHGTAEHYDEAQRRAWAPAQPFAGWNDRLASAECFVAELDGLVVGFVSASHDGHVDLAYVLPERHGSGIGSRLLRRVEDELRMSGVRRLVTEASLVARPFFAARGWRVAYEETVELDGQKLRRFRMFKPLGAQAASQAS